MAPSTVDSAVLRALSLSPASAKMTSHGGSGFVSTNRLTTPDMSIFVKTSSSTDAEVMFQGEHESLNAIHAAVPSLCPRSLAWGELEQSKGYFLATEFLDMGGDFNRTRSTSDSKASGMTLAQETCHAALYSSSNTRRFRWAPIRLPSDNLLWSYAPIEFILIIMVGVLCKEQTSNDP